MRVLYFADTRFPIERANGIQTMATCHALAARGHRVELIVRPDTAPVARDPFEFYGVPAVRALSFVAVPSQGGPVRSRLRFLLGAVGRVSRRRNAVVCTRDLGLAATLLGLPAPLRPRLVYESHGIASVVGEELPRLLGADRVKPSAAKLRRLDRRERRVWKRAAACVAITRALATELAGRYGDPRAVFVVPDGADDPGLDGLTPGEARDDSRQPIAAYAGHLYPWKGVDVFVRALALAPGIRGLIVGGHPGERDLGRIERLAADLGVTGRLEVTGLVRPAEVPARLVRADILVLPNTASAISDRYTSPLKLFEYLWLGRPIVASDLAAVREVLEDGESALFVPPGDAAALARALERLAADTALGSRLGATARRLAPDYTWAARAARLEAALDTAAGVR